MFTRLLARLLILIPKRQSLLLVVGNRDMKKTIFILEGRASEIGYPLAIAMHKEPEILEMFETAIKNKNESERIAKNLFDNLTKHVHNEKCK